MRRILVFYAVFVLFTPSFKDFLDYFYNFNAMYDALIEIIVFLSVLLITIVYSEWLEDYALKPLVRTALCALTINSAFNALLVANITFGLGKFGFVSLQTILFDAIYQVLLWLPAFVAVSQLIPKNVEASVFGILKSLQAMSVLVWGRILGSIVYSVTTNRGKNLEFDLLYGMLVIFGIAVIMFIFATSLPSNEDIEAVQRAIFYNAVQSVKQFDRTRIDLN